MRKFITILLIFILTGCASNSGLEDNGIDERINKPEIVDCEDLVLPQNTEVNSNLNTEEGTLELSWYDEQQKEDVRYIVNYNDPVCSESVKVYIDHLNIEDTVDNGGASNTTKQKSERDVSLTFNAVTNNQAIHNISQLDNTKTVKEQSIDGGTVIIYSKQDDQENIYGAFKTKDAKYELGVVGGFSLQMDDYELLSIKELAFNGKSLLCIIGVFGANAPVQNYFSLENGEITPFLRVDTGHAVELDLDDNGTTEIVSSHGTPNQSYVYKWEKDRFYVSNINDTLNATSVYLDEESQFNVSYEDPNTIEKYKYQSGSLILLN